VVTFSAIPGTYTTIKLVIWGQVSATSDAVSVTLNGDTGNNYALTGYYQTGTSAPAGLGTTSQANCPLTNAANAGVGMFAVEVPFYSNTSFPKVFPFSMNVMTSVSSLTASTDSRGTCLWSKSGNPAVTSVTWTLASGYFLAGTELQILAQL
jgi:hypothetical protein